MKNNLFIFILCSMLFVQLPGFANIKLNAYSTSKCIKLQDSSHHNAQRSPVPTQVFQIDHLLTVESLDFESDFKITITNISTDEVVYEQTYHASTKYITIDLGTEEIGEYKIELSSANWQLYGNFDL